MVLELGICEIYTPIIHGLNEKTSSNMLGNYIVIEKVSLQEYYHSQFFDLIDIIQYKWNYLETPNIVENLYNHPIIANFEQMVKDPNFIRLDIIESAELEGGEMVGYKKTFWIKIIQRLYKRVWKERKTIIALRKMPSSLHFKRISGRWPKCCFHMPEYKMQLS